MKYKDFSQVRSLKYMGLKELFGIKRNNQEDVTEEEIMSMVLEGHEQGVLQESEAEMINNIFSLDEKEAQDVMVHRKSIEAVDGDMTLAEFLSWIGDKSFSRYPVYQEDIDNIIGVIHIKDILCLMLKRDNLELKLNEIDNLIRNISFIPETRNIDVLFQKMRALKTHMVIVVDEYGQTAGLVTMEDILEEIVGNILDEHDQEELFIIPEKNGSYLMDGMTELSEVCELLSIEKDEELEDFDTLNGYLISLIDKIPSDGEVFTVEGNGYRFDVLLVENKMIRTVRVTKIQDKEGDGLPE